MATTYLPRGFTEGSGNRAQRETVDRLRAAANPIFFMEASRHAELGLKFARVPAYLEANSRVAREADFGGSRSYRELVDARRAPSGTYEPLSLPWYAGPRTGIAGLGGSRGRSLAGVVLTGDRDARS